MINLYMLQKKSEVTITDDEVESYLKQWYSNEGFSDFNLAIDRGLIIYAANLIIGAGAIEPIDEESIQVLAWYNKFATKAAIKREHSILLRNVEVWVNPETYEHHFVPYSDIDYFMTQTDLQKCCGKFEVRYNNRGRACKTSVMEA